MVKTATRLGIVAILLCLTCMSCKRSGQSVEAENFDEFYRLFLTSDSFQISRIEFPLDGFESDADTTIYWNNPKDWALISGSVYDIDTTEYKVEKEFLPEEVTFKVYLEDSGFSITQVYELIDGKWYLTMYDSMSY